MGIRVFRFFRVTLPAICGILIAVPAVSTNISANLEKLVLSESENAIPGIGDQWQGMAAEKERPDEIKSAPESLGKEARWFNVNAGGRNLVFAVESDPPRLYCDTNFDGDMTAEKGLEAKLDQNDFARFGVIQVKGERQDKPGSIRVRVHIGNDGADYAVISPAEARKGSLQVGDDKLTVYLVDTTFNGRIDDSYSDGKAYDRAAFDFDGDGSINPWAEVIPLPPRTVLNNTVYSVVVAEDASSIELQEQDVPEGTLTTAHEAMFTLISNVGVVRIHPGGGPWKLPAGKYRVASLELKEFDDNGKFWTTGCLSLGESEWVEIVAGKNTQLKLGTPLELRKKISEEDGKTVVNLELVGQGGEKYFPYPRTNAEGVPAVKVTILGKDDAELASGGIEYG